MVCAHSATMVCAHSATIISVIAASGQKLHVKGGFSRAVGAEVTTASDRLEVLFCDLGTGGNCLLERLIVRTQLGMPDEWAPTPAGTP
jgi:hypothetical protein